MRGEVVSTSNLLSSDRLSLLAGSSRASLNGPVMRYTQCSPSSFQASCASVRTRPVKEGEGSGQP